MNLAAQLEQLRARGFDEDKAQVILLIREAAILLFQAFPEEHTMEAISLNRRATVRSVSKDHLLLQKAEAFAFRRGVKARDAYDIKLLLDTGAKLSGGVGKSSLGHSGDEGNRKRGISGPHRAGHGGFVPRTTGGRSAW